MGWTKHYSKTHKRDYWYNSDSGISTWKKPDPQTLMSSNSEKKSEVNIFNNFKEKGYRADTESLHDDSNKNESKSKMKNQF